MGAAVSGQVWCGASDGSRHHANVGTFMMRIQFMTRSRLREARFSTPC